jgi:hypothetical protein
MKPRRLLKIGEGPAPFVGLRFNTDDLAIIDAIAEQHELSRSAAIRALVKAGLDRETTHAS